MSKVQQLKTRALKNPKVKKEYVALAEDFALADQLIAMRAASGLTQTALAEIMGTQKSNISRLENGNSNPGWATLKKYAEACGFEINLSCHPR